MLPLLPRARTTNLHPSRLCSLACLLGVGPSTAPPLACRQLPRAWPRTTTTASLRRPYSTPPSASSSDAARSRPDDERASQPPVEAERFNSDVIALPAPSPSELSADPEASAESPDSLQPTPSARSLGLSSQEEHIDHQGSSPAATLPSKLADHSTPDELPKRSRADASSSSPSSSSSSPRPPDWRPPFPLPTDVATTLFRLRSLYVSTSHLVRGRLAEAFVRLEDGMRTTRATLEEERVRLLTAGKLVFGQVGGRVNSVTGYDGIERLKESVRVKEDALTELRAALTTAKTTYHQTLSSASSSQRELNDLLQRKHSWSSSDVERFTLLVREDHQSTSAATQAKDEVERLEAEADRAFDGLMRAILQRYHEEQTWSDKLRSLSSYTQLLVLGVNALLFLGAVAVVEPWKRRRMVEGFEGRVREMTAELGTTIRAEVEGLRQELVAAQELVGSPVTAPTGPSIILPEPPVSTLADDPAALPPPSVAHLLEPPATPLFLPHPTFPFHYPSPDLLALPSKAMVVAQENCARAWNDPTSSERALAIAAGVGAGAGAVIVALCKG